MVQRCSVYRESGTGSTVLRGAPTSSPLHSGKVQMRVLMRSFVLVFLAIVGAVLLALTSTMTSIVSAAATQIFAMGGTGHPERGRDQLRRPRLGGHAVDRHSDGRARGLHQDRDHHPRAFRFDTGLTDLTFDRSVAEGPAEPRQLHRRKELQLQRAGLGRSTLRRVQHEPCRGVRLFTERHDRDAREDRPGGGFLARGARRASPFRSSVFTFGGSTD